MPTHVKCKVCGAEKPAEEVLIAPERSDSEPGEETERWTGPICRDCRKKLKEGKG